MAKKPQTSEAGELTNPHNKFFKEIFSKPELAADFVRSYLPPTIVNSKEKQLWLHLHKRFFKQANSRDCNEAYKRVLLK